MEVRLYEREMGSFTVDPSVPWSVIRIPIPEDLAQPNGLVSLRVPGWRPVDRGLGDDRRLRRIFRKELDRLQTGLATFETVRRFHLAERDLTIEEGLLTPTLKPKRKKIIERFGGELSALYG